jgi:putative ABC transport system substrate-binding protein
MTGRVIALLLALFLAPLAADAQPAGKVWRIGVLLPGPLVPLPPGAVALQLRLLELGYVEGQNIAFEYRSAENKLERLPDLAAELVRLKVDIIYATVTPAAQAAKNATKTIPIVFSASSDPVGFGLVASLARPGGNVTGMSNAGPDLSGKRLELLKEVVPGVSRVAVLWNSANAVIAHQVKETEAAAKVLGIQLQVVGVRGPDDIEGALAVSARGRVGALIVLADFLTVYHRGRIADLAAKNRLPAIYELREFVAAGGLMAYGPSLPDMGRRAAIYVDKILKGAKPADLPVEQPTKFELVINMKTAKALGLTIPQSVLLRADHVIE